MLQALFSCEHNNICALVKRTSDVYGYHVDFNFQSKRPTFFVWKEKILKGKQRRRPNDNAALLGIMLSQKLSLSLARVSVIFSRILLPCFRPFAIPVQSFNVGLACAPRHGFPPADNIFLSRRFFRMEALFGGPRDSIWSDLSGPCPVWRELDGLRLGTL